MKSKEMSLEDITRELRGVQVFEVGTWNGGKYTEKDLEDLINKVIDEQINCQQLPYVCSILSSESGKGKVFKYIKDAILKDGITDIYAALAHLENDASCMDSY